MDMLSLLYVDTYMHMYTQNLMTMYMCIYSIHVYVHVRMYIVVIACFEVLRAEYSTRRAWSRGPIQHEAKPSAVVWGQDYGLQVLYSTGTARTKRALTNLLYFCSN